MNIHLKMNLKKIKPNSLFMIPKPSAGKIINYLSGILDGIESTKEEVA